MTSTPGADRPPSSPHGDETRKNRLANSSSPYLLLHQYNPVDWYPWGEEALQKAREEDKPIFLSVGYSSCYWCHVMERESFSDPEIAAAMNRDFISIKVDREERPDLDEIYMAATQMLTGQGGWPNSVFLTPDLEPFFAGTYFPPEDRYGRSGFPSVLQGVSRVWREQRDKVVKTSNEIAERMGLYLQGDATLGAEIPGPEGAARSLTELEARFDSLWGGFGGAPKFPSPSNLFFLLEAGDQGQARHMLESTLDQMARGGIYDQLGGGFHRYATDREWKVPHFEKMLYDNGLLLEVYARAYEAHPNPEWRRVIEETVGFLRREMLDSEGGFWSAIDAETNGHEGAYYVWTRAEIEAVLGAADAKTLAPVLGFSGGPFFEKTRYVLHFPAPVEELATERTKSREKLLEEIGPWRRKLRAARTERERPLTDDKVLADWNGMTIAGLATAGRVLEDPKMTEMAARAARFVLDSMWIEVEGQRELQHTYRQGRSHIPAFLADYSYLVHGLLALHRATGKTSWLEAAEELTREQQRRLGDSLGAFFVAAESEDVLFRSRDPFDGAVPSANGVALWNLLELAEVTKGSAATEYRKRAGDSLRVFADVLERQPSGARSLSLGAVRLAGGWPGTTPGSVAKSAEGGLSSEAESVVQSHLRVDAETSNGERAFTVTLEIAEGWHLNANPASLDFLIPTSLATDDGQSVEVAYPAGEVMRFAFAEDALSVYEGRIDLQGRLPKEFSAKAIELTYQACDDARCLPPVTRLLALP